MCNLIVLDELCDLHRPLASNPGTPVVPSHRQNVPLVKRRLPAGLAQTLRNAVVHLLPLVTVQKAERPPRATAVTKVHTPLLMQPETTTTKPILRHCECGFFRSVPTVPLRSVRHNTISLLTHSPRNRVQVVVSPTNHVPGLVLSLHIQVHPVVQTPSLSIQEELRSTLAPGFHTIITAVRQPTSQNTAQTTMPDALAEMKVSPLGHRGIQATETSHPLGLRLLHKCSSRRMHGVTIFVRRPLHLADQLLVLLLRSFVINVLLQLLQQLKATLHLATRLEKRLLCVPVWSSPRNLMHNRLLQTQPPPF
mmetsp:Transcript_15268/g.36817  ORF Transcript_15268/g.36817 Transcript_15268/m.36817 type:complete len:308 (+) Transcript_15268:3-926(+)